MEPLNIARERSSEGQVMQGDGQSSRQRVSLGAPAGYTNNFTPPVWLQVAFEPPTILRVENSYHTPTGERRRRQPQQQACNDSPSVGSVQPSGPASTSPP